MKRRSRRGIFTVVSGRYTRSHKTRRAAIEEAEYLERRGYTPYVYEFNIEAPERHRRIVHGPGAGKAAP